LGELRRAWDRGFQLVQRFIEIRLNAWDEQILNVFILIRSTREVLRHVKHRDGYCYTARLDTGRRRRSPGSESAWGTSLEPE
jgi:hypothetical protein